MYKVIFDPPLKPSNQLSSIVDLLDTVGAWKTGASGNYAAKALTEVEKLLVPFTLIEHTLNE